MLRYSQANPICSWNESDLFPESKIWIFVLFRVVHSIPLDLDKGLAGLSFPKK